MTSLNSDGLSIEQQDLSNNSPSPDDDGRLYLHDGSSSIALTDGSTSSKKNYYMWNDTSGAWNPMKGKISTVEGLDTDGSTATVRDTTNALDVAQFKEGGNVEIPNGNLRFSNAVGVTGTTTGGATGNVLKLNRYDNIEFGDPNGANNWAEFYTTGKQAGYFDHNQNLILNGNDVHKANAVTFGSSGDRVLYRGNMGLIVEKSFGSDATLHKISSPPEADGGKEATLALVQGDNDEYVYDLYNNTGYTSGDRAARWGVSLKHQGTATAMPYIIDFDNSSLGGSGNVPRFEIQPQGRTKFRNGDVNVVGNNLLEQGNRVATRLWANNNADVPNADYADNAGDSDTVDGYDIQKNGTDGAGIINFKT